MIWGLTLRQTLKVSCSLVASAPSGMQQSVALKRLALGCVYLTKEGQMREELERGSRFKLDPVSASQLLRTVVASVAVL
jgi:hypothetical protein